MDGITIKATVGERQMAFVNSLKGLDEDKEMQLMYENSLKDLARAMFDMSDEDFENKDVKPLNDAH